MGGAGGHADRDISDTETADSMNRSQTHAWMLRNDRIERAPHLLFGHALVGLVVEPQDFLSFRIVPDDSAKRADASGAGMLDRPARVVDRDGLVHDAAACDLRPTGDRWKHVDSVAIPKLFRAAGEFVVDGEAHSRKEVGKPGKARGYGGPKLGLRDSVRFELERGAFAPGELARRGVVRNDDLHEGVA